jgi:putative ABC transport system substrate-binding protein
MRRRDFISWIGSSAVVWPLASRAQQPANPVIGFLNSGSPEAFAQLAAAFRQGLSESGYVEHQNLAIEYRWAEGAYDQLLRQATDLVHRQVDVIVAGGPPGAGREGGHHDYPYRLRERRQSSRAWARVKPQPTGWQHHGSKLLDR